MEWLLAARHLEDGARSDQLLLSVALGNGAAWCWWIPIRSGPNGG